MSDSFNGWGSQPIPYSQEAEEATIGAILVNPVAYFGVASFLKEDDFFILRHKYIWQALTRLADRNEPIDYLTLTQELRDMDKLAEIGGPAYLTQLINSTPTSVHAEVYGKLVERAATRRRLMAASDEIKALALNEELSIEQVINDAEAKLFDVTERQLTKELIPMREAISNYFDRIEHLMYDQGAALGIPTGFKDLDKLLGGLQKSDLLLFAGRPGMGKCVVEGTLIPTERGLLPIEALKPQQGGIADDEGGVYYPLEIGVQTPGGIQKTAYFYDSGLKPTLKITTRAGYSVTGTYTHPLLTITRTGKTVWKHLLELRRGDYVAVENGGKFGSPFVPAWDEITSIEDAGIRHCYDLTVPNGNSFVANGIVNHNTSFMLSAAVNMARLGARIAIFSMEMGVEQIVQRIVSMEAAINSQNLRTGQISQQEWARFVQAAGNLSNFRIYIDDTPAMSPLQMRTKCLRMAREHGIDLVIVDYVQLMNAGGSYENNRVQEISYISRNMKEMARELNVPVMSAAQLSRAVENRQDKRPQLSDLRESGCLAGESLVYLPDEGRYVPIRDLVGKVGFRVMSLNTKTWKLEPGIVTNAFATGVKPVYRLTTQLGRTIRATANHKFLTIQGWRRLDELTENDHIALPRRLDGPCEQTMSNAELALLGHLIGDGCTLPRHVIQYTTREEDLAETVAALATEVFGDEVKPHIHHEVVDGKPRWYQVFLPTTRKITHGVRNPISDWLTELGVFGLRSHEKRIPEKVFAQPPEAIALFLRHLWATDGSIRMKRVSNGLYPNIYYATSSEQLSYDVQSLLLRLEINAIRKQVPQKGKGRHQYPVHISGKDDIVRFLQLIGGVGNYKRSDAEIIWEHISQRNAAYTKRDVIPTAVWKSHIIPAIRLAKADFNHVLQHIGHYGQVSEDVVAINVDRSLLKQVAEVVQSDCLNNLSDSDVYWDAIASIELDTEEEVYDITVEKYHDFVCSNIIIHNSLEQDADVVMFLYRDEVYNEATEFPNQADIIVAKHRNGPTGTISLYFEKTLTKFMNAAERSVDLSHI
jgi:replicative DNA helicase